MSLLLREVSLSLEEEESILPEKIAQYLNLPVDAIQNLRIVRKGIDARKKPRVKRIYSLSFSVPDEESVLRQHQTDHRVAVAPERIFPATDSLKKPVKVLVAGMGPAGLFTALHLARRGIKVTLVERGEPVEERVRKVQAFWAGGPFDPRSNVQFGEGGAGTFSDGKLTTRVNSPWAHLILQSFVDCGAPAEILFEAKPHLGTDVLRRVLVNFRHLLEEAGVDIQFNSCLTDILVNTDTVHGGIVNDRVEIPAEAVVLAPGHSSRDTYAMLAERGVAIDQKPFAIGLRVEHPTELINQIQYGMSGHAKLPTADYALSYNDAESGRSVYSFCMCPGGEIIAAPSEEGGMVVNGMSYRNRNRPGSNSALVVSVGPGDFDGSDPLAGVRFQQHWEQVAFAAGGSDYRAPAQNLMGFADNGNGPVHSSCRPGVREAELATTLPPQVVAALQRGLPHFDKKMKGFVSREAVLVGIESRTSAPLRILRNPEGESVSHPGLYPVGEGAGYAGGIMSAALDGLKTADKIIQKLSRGVISEKDIC